MATMPGSSDKYLNMSLDEIIRIRKQNPGSRSVGGVSTKSGQGFRTMRGRGGRGRGRGGRGRGGMFRGGSRGMFRGGRGGIFRGGRGGMFRGWGGMRGRNNRRGFNNSFNGSRSTPIQRKYVGYQIGRGQRYGFSRQNRGFFSPRRGRMFRGRFASRGFNRAGSMFTSYSHLPLSGLSTSMLNRIGLPGSGTPLRYNEHGGNIGYMTRQIALHRIQKARQYFQMRRQFGRYEAINQSRGIQSPGSMNGSTFGGRMRTDEVLRRRRLQMYQQSRILGTPSTRDDDDTRSVISNKTTRSFQIHVDNEFAPQALYGGQTLHPATNYTASPSIRGSENNQAAMVPSNQLSKTLQKEIAAIQGRSVAEAMAIGTGEGIGYDFRPTPGTTVCSLSDRFGATSGPR